MRKELKEFIAEKVLEGVGPTRIAKQAAAKFGDVPCFKTIASAIRSFKKKREAEDYEDFDPNPDIENFDDDLIKMKASNQKLQDKNRLSNKLLREQIRLSNANKELLETLLERLPRIQNFKPKSNSVNYKIIDRAAIIQLSDLHLNEVVVPDDTIGLNEHNYDIASKRLWKYANNIRERLGNRVDYILVALTGDILNSDRRPDEKLMNAGNRTEALLFAVQVLSSFLVDLGRDYQLGVVSVVGNESRIDPDIQWIDPTHNYDFLIHRMLADSLIEWTGDIDFFEVKRSYETVVELCGANILLTHGHTKLDWKSAVTKYNARGTILNYMISGHFHSTKINDKYSRSASTVGCNFYSVYNLHLIGRAAQNMYEIEKEPGAKYPVVTPIVIDLQNVQGCGMYQYNKDVCKSGMRKSLKKKGTNNIIIKLVE